jgi:hypothetical protein
MGTKYSGTFFISLIFGVIGYIVCSFFVDQQLALILAFFTFASYFIVFFIYRKVYMKNANKIDLSDIDNISFKDMANYYKDRLIGNGILIFTLERLVFIPTDNKKEPMIEFMLQEIQRVTYDKIFKHIKGIKVEFKDGTTIGFVTPRYNEILELFNLYKENSLL